MDQRIKQFVDNGLKIMQDLGLMQIPDPYMPIEMVDTSRKSENDWIPWKPIKSTVTVDDIKELEGLLKHSLPSAYVEYLQYLHFYEIDTATDIVFFPHVIHQWKKELIENFFNAINPDLIIGKGYIYIADSEGYSAICFDTNRGEGNDYPIVEIDHDFDDLVIDLFPNFMSMINHMIASQAKKLQ